MDSYYIPTGYPNGLPDGIGAEVYNKPAAEEAVQPDEELVMVVGGKLKGR